MQNLNRYENLWAIWKWEEKIPPQHFSPNHRVTTTYSVAYDSQSDLLFAPYEVSLSNRGKLLHVLKETFDLRSSSSSCVIRSRRNVRRVRRVFQVQTNYANFFSFFSI